MIRTQVLNFLEVEGNVFFLHEFFRFGKNKKVYTMSLYETLILTTFWETNINWLVKFHLKWSLSVMHQMKFCSSLKYLISFYIWYLFHVRLNCIYLVYFHISKIFIHSIIIIWNVYFRIRNNEIRCRNVRILAQVPVFSEKRSHRTKIYSS